MEKSAFFWVLTYFLFTPYAHAQKTIDGIFIQTNFVDISNTSNKIKDLYLQKPETPEAESLIRQMILKAMENKGFYKPVINLNKSSGDPGEDRVTYNLKVNEGYPCIIDKIYFPFHLPSSQNIDLKRGDLCDIDLIQKSTDELTYRLKKAGYFQAQLEFSELKKDLSSTKADVIITGTLGKQRHYKILDLDAQRYRNDFFQERKTEDFYLRGYNLDTIQSQVLRYYQENGYSEVKIEDTYPSYEDESRVVYTLEVKLGPIYRVHEVVFLGNTRITSADLIGILGLGGFLNSQVIYDKDKISENLENIRSEYQKMGFLNAKANIVSTNFDKNTRQVKLIISITEGVYRQLTNVKIEGITSETQAYIDYFLKPYLNQAFVPEVITGIEEILKKTYADLGYPYHQILWESQEINRGNTNFVSLKFSLDPGPKVYFGKIFVEGLTRTNLNVVMREVRFSEGDVYTPEKLAKLRSKLTGLGLFKSVIVSPSLSSSRDSRPIDVKIILQESYSGNISFGPGFNLKKGLQYVGELSYGNLGGTGRKVSIKTSISQEKDQSVPKDATPTYNRTRLGRKIGFGYVEPFLVNLPITGNFSLLNTSAFQIVWSNSYTLELGATYSPDWVFALKTGITPFYRLKVNQDFGSQQQTDYLLSTGQSQIGSIGLKVVLDARDSVEWPTRGINLTQEISTATFWLGGDYRYMEQDFALSTYFRLFGDMILGVYGNFKTFYNISREMPGDPPVLPTTERLLAGAANQVRGFGKELGPYVYTQQGPLDPLGANKRLVFKTDIRKKIYKDKLATSLFLDSGNTFFSKEEEQNLNSILLRKSSDENPPFIADNAPYTFDEVWKRPRVLWERNYASYGVALSYLSPLGAINLSAAKALHEPETKTCETLGICNPRKSSGEKWFQSLKFDFSIGNQF